MKKKVFTLREGKGKGKVEGHVFNIDYAMDVIINKISNFIYERKVNSSS